MNFLHFRGNFENCPFFWFCLSKFQSWCLFQIGRVAEQQSPKQRLPNLDLQSDKGTKYNSMLILFPNVGSEDGSFFVNFCDDCSSLVFELTSSFRREVILELNSTNKIKLRRKRHVVA